MFSISDSIEFVKHQIEYQDRRAVITRDDPKKLNFHTDIADKFRALLSFLENLSNTPIPNPSLANIDPTGALQPSELFDLPDELKAELVGSIDKQEMAILEAIKEAGGSISLDRILISIYKKTGEVVKRNLLTAKLYRMSQNGLIYRVPKRKGIYTTDASLGVQSSEEDEE